MSPEQRRAPLPKVPEVPDGQGVLITGEVALDGGVPTITVVPSGCFPDTENHSKPPTDTPVDVDRITAATNNELNRRQAISSAHRGKHTIGSDGPKVGDVFPDGTVVTKRGYPGARARWRRETAAKEQAAPPLFPTNIGRTPGPPAADGETAHRTTPPKLTNVERAKAVAEYGSNLGFVPPTMTEISDALYFESSPEEITRVVNVQLDRIFWGAQRAITESGDYPPEFGLWRGRRAAYSKIYEMTDYWTDAHKAIGELERLMARLKDVNPDTYVSNVISGYDCAYGRVTQHLVGLQLAAGEGLPSELSGRFASVEDAMKPVYDRWYTEPPLLPPDGIKKRVATSRFAGRFPYRDVDARNRHKIVYSTLTHPDVDNGLKAAMRIMVGGKKVGAVRALAEQGLASQRRRAEYWRLRLQAIDTAKYPMPVDGSANKPSLRW
ncbi:hypothetical protein CSA80_03340 [Candidatus Saccharibacteria bacterium]|nr:MAG: hypothetical protein CSA80_03340 [Candidatus Saccharibacteria bacterium]